MTSYLDFKVTPLIDPEYFRNGTRYRHSYNGVPTTSKQAVSLIKNLTNADNDNSMNMSTKMEMSQVNKSANMQTMQYVKINIQTYKHQ